NYLNGAIRFPDTVAWTAPGAGQALPAEPIAGKRVRIFYRTQQNWAVQLTKAFTNYVRDPNPDPQAGPGYGFFAVGTMGYLYFPIQDHDQSVLVDYTWVHRVNGQDVV